MHQKVGPDLGTGQGWSANTPVSYTHLIQSTTSFYKLMRNRGQRAIGDNIETVNMDFSMFEAVSYTHLDVYKRQPQCHTTQVFSLPTEIKILNTSGNSLAKDIDCCKRNTSVPRKGNLFITHYSFHHISYIYKMFY